MHTLRDGAPKPRLISMRLPYSNTVFSAPLLKRLADGRKVRSFASTLAFNRASRANATIHRTCRNPELTELRQRAAAKISISAEIGFRPRNVGKRRVLNCARERR
jgi:hypothetical protein